MYFFKIIWIWKWKNIEFITLNDYHIQPKEYDLIYIDAEKLSKIEKPLSQILTKRELVNYERIKEIPFVFEYSKSYRYCTKKDKNFNSKNSSETITDIDDLLIKNVPLCFVEKNDFYKMLNIMYEDTYTNCFLNNYEYLEYDYEYFDDEDFLKISNLLILMI